MALARWHCASAWRAPAPPAPGERQSSASGLAKQICLPTNSTHDCLIVLFPSILLQCRHPLQTRLKLFPRPLLQQNRSYRNVKDAPIGHRFKTVKMHALQCISSRANVFKTSLYYVAFFLSPKFRMVAVSPQIKLRDIKPGILAIAQSGDFKCMPQKKSTLQSISITTMKDLLTRILVGKNL